MLNLLARALSDGSKPSFQSISFPREECMYFAILGELQYFLRNRPVWDDLEIRLKSFITSWLCVLLGIKLRLIEIFARKSVALKQTRRQQVEGLVKFWHER